MRAAKLRHVGAAIEDVDYHTPRQLDRDLFRQLAQGDWIEKRQNLIITGPCGVGKTWLACALGQKACRDGRGVLYRRLPRLFAELELAHGDGRFPRLFRPSVKAGRPALHPEPVFPADAAAARDVSVERLQRQLRGDLDNIVMMALRKEPDRRYSSAEQLKQDLDRHVGGLPVTARPSTVGYRVRKFLARHRAATVATLLVLLSLVAGTGVALWQAREAHQERDRAEQLLARSETVTRFLMDLFEANDPQETKGIEVTARELLERGVERAEVLHEQPAVQAHLFDVVGRVYERLGQYEPAEALLNRALGLHRASLGERHLLVTESMTHLAAVLNRRGRYEEAEALLRQALAIQAELLDQPHPIQVNTLHQLGHLLPYLGKVQEAEAVRREALATHRALLGNEHPLVARSLISLGAILRAQGRYDETEVLLREALAMYQRTQGANHPDVTRSQFQLAILLKQQGAHDEAESLLRQAIDLRRNLEGEGDPEIASYLFELGDVLHETGKSAEAERMIRQAVALLQRVLGDHPTTSGGLAFLASFLHERGMWGEADSLYREALSMHQRLLGAEHQGVAEILHAWGRLHIDTGSHEEAGALLSRAHAMYLEVNGPDHHHVGGALSDLALLHQRTGNMAKADSLYRAALALLRKQHRDEHIDVQAVYTRLADLHEAWGTRAQADHYRARVNRPAPRQ